MNYIKTFFTDKPVSKCILTNLSLFMQKRIRGMTILLKMKRGANSILQNSHAKQNAWPSDNGKIKLNPGSLQLH